MRQFFVTVLLLLTVLSVAMAAPKVNYNFDAARNAGLTLVTPGDSNFQLSLAPFRENPSSKMEEFSIMEPFSFVIKNTTKRPISILVVSWDRTDNGVTRPAGVFTYRTRKNLIDANFQPGQSMALFPGAGGFGPNLIAVKSAERQLRTFLQAQSLTVTLDAIAFGDGELVGEDKYGLSVTLDAEHKAVGDLVDDMMTLVARHEDSAEYLKTVAGQDIQPTLSLVDHARDFAYHYAQMRATAAGLLQTSSSDARVQLEKLKLIHSKMSLVHRAEQ